MLELWREIAIAALGVLNMILMAWGSSISRKADKALADAAALRTHVAENYQTKADADKQVTTVTEEIRDLRTEMREGFRAMTSTIIQTITSKPNGPGH